MYFLSVNNSEKSCPIYIFATMNRNFQIFESFRESLLSISGDIDFSSIGRISELENRFMRRHLLGKSNLSDWRQKKKYRRKEFGRISKKKSAVNKISRPVTLEGISEVTGLDILFTADIFLQCLPNFFRRFFFLTPVR